VEYLPSAAPKPSSPSTRTTEVEQLDEDDDELDLIGPSTSYIHREQPSPRRITAIPSTNVNPESLSTREVLEQELGSTISIEPSFKEVPVSPAMESAFIEKEQEEHADILIGIEGTKERTTPQHPNDVSEKDSEVNKGMEVDEETEVAQRQNIEPLSDEEMDVDEETKNDAGNSLPIRIPNEHLPSPIVDTFEAGVSGTATQQPVPDAAEEPPLDRVTSLEKKEVQSGTRSNPSESGTPITYVPKPPKYTPIHFPLPPSIQEAILIPAPISNDEETVFNLDFEPELIISSPVPTNIENRQRYDLKYTLPPLSVLPTDFTRKVKPRRKKDGKREKDDAVPMGLTRWGATIMANPLWKRVAKATKCLNTREWGVRDV
jgi:chromatin modification-related protein VID21